MLIDPQTETVVKGLYSYMILSYLNLLQSSVLLLEFCSVCFLLLGQLSLYICGRKQLLTCTEELTLGKVECVEVL